MKVIIDKFDIIYFINDNNQIHNDYNKPAVMFINNASKAWWKNNDRHREFDKHARIFDDGKKERFINGKKYINEYNT